MKLAIDIARFTAWASLTALFCMLWWVAFEMRAVPARVDGVLMRAEGVESKINASAVNLDAATKAWAGSASEQARSIDGLVKDARGTLTETSAAVTELRGAVITANAQLTHVAPVLDQARVTIAGVGEQAQALGEAAKPVLEGAAKTEADVDAFVTAPELRATMVNVEQTSVNVRITSGNFAAMTTDSRDWMHTKLYPTKRKGFVSGFEATGDVLKHWWPSLF